jgi:hypothetical protein
MEVSKSASEFVEKWVCLHTGIDKTMKATMRQDLRHLIWYAMENAIDMYVEMRERHGQEPVVAKAKAALEVAEGLDA